MSLAISSGQENAVQRRSLYGAVYALSGTLLSRVSGLDAAPVRWATRTFSGGPTGDLYEAYLGPPDKIEEELPFKLGDEAPGHPVNIPVRNLPFRHADSLLAAIVDGDYAWEGCEATLYVGYLEPGKEPGDLAPEDWTAVRKRGQFGAPQEVQQDGFRLPLYPRDSLRRQTLNFKRAERVDWPELDPADEGRVIPVVIGSPDSWVPMIRVSGGVYGKTVRPVLSGTASGVHFRTDFPADLVSGLIGKQVYVHRLDKPYLVSGVTDLRLTAGSPAPWFLSFASGLDFNVPQGALIQQKQAGYRFVPSVNPMLNFGAAPSFFTGLAAVALWGEDGSIIPINVRRNAGGNANLTSFVDADAPYGGWDMFELRDNDQNFDESFPGQPPAIVPRLNLPNGGAAASGTVVIVSQPEFTPSVSDISATKENNPTGPLSESDAFDGNEDTGASLGAFGSITFTFPSVPGGQFANGDTIKSTLHFVTQGDIDIDDGGTELFFVASSASKNRYRIVLPDPVPFNQTVRIRANTAGGGIVYEVWWEHELETTLELDRTQDVDADTEITISGINDGGNELRPIRGLLMKFEAGSDAVIPGKDFYFNPWSFDIEGAAPFTRAAMWPSAIFANLQKQYLEDGGPFTDDEADYEPFLDLAAYAEATEQYKARNIRLNFVITEPMSWPDMERQLALQCRSYAFWGPNGHQLIVLPDPDEVIPVERTFRLPGTPDPNCTLAPGQPLIERTSPSTIINRVEMYWARQWHLGSQADVQERFRKYSIGRNDESAAVFGPRYDAAGAQLGWAISDLSFVPSGVSYTGEAHAQDLVDFLAARQGFAQTRFCFETGHPAYGLTQGSSVRVAFSVAEGVYRNVVCEVEDIQTSPINAERRILTCRSIQLPVRGLEPAIIWTDLFTQANDTWAEKFTNTRDRWQHYFEVPT